MGVMQLPVRVITDSASDLPSDLAGDADIRVVPLDVRFGDELFVVGQTIDGPSFWRRLATAADLPETAPPPPHRFSLEIKEAANDGARGVVILTMSAEVSATYQAAVMAAEEQASTIPIRVVDSGTLSMAQGFAALAAARANRYASRQQWKQAAEAFDQLRVISANSPEAWWAGPTW